MKGLARLVVMFFITVGVIMICVILVDYAIKKMGGESPYKDDGDIPEDTVIFASAPQRISKDHVVNYLFLNGGGKLKNAGESFYQEGVRFNIDPAFALAVSKTETSLGISQCDVTIDVVPWYDCNNFFCLQYDSALFKEPGDGRCSGTKWASFRSVERGITAFFGYIDSRYIRGTPAQTTASEIGCAPTGFDRCYCESSGKDCRTWSESVTRNMKDIRAFGAND